MSGIIDLCACICAQIQQQLRQVTEVLQSVNGEEVITSSGSAAFGLPPPRDHGVASNAFVPLLLVVLFIVMLASLRRGTPPTIEKPRSFGSDGSSSSGSPPPPPID